MIVREVSNRLFTRLIPLWQANGTAAPSITSKLIDDATGEDGVIINESLIAKAVAMAYAGLLDLLK